MAGLALPGPPLRALPVLTTVPSPGHAQSTVGTRLRPLPAGFPACLAPVRRTP